MSRTTKIVCGVAAAAVCLFGAGIGLAGYFFFEAMQGVTQANEGYAAVRAGDNDKAIARFDAALTKPIPPQQRVFVYMNRGAAYNAKKRYDEAIRDLTAAIQLDPTFAYSYLGRAWAYEQKGENDKAIKDYGEAIQRDPNSESAYSNRGLIFYHQRGYVHAVADFGEAARCQPNHAYYFLMRGICYAALNDLDRALANLDAAIQLDPTNASALTERGNLYKRRGEKDRGAIDLEAARHFAARRSVQPKARTTPALPSEFERGTHLDVKPLPKVETNGIAFGQTFAATLASADAAYNAGNFDQAISGYDRALAMDIARPQASLAVMRRGNAHLAKEEITAALTDFNEAIGLDSKNAAAYDDRGLALQRKGDFDEAVKDFDESIRLSPMNTPSYLNRGYLFLQENDLDRALTDFVKATDMRPDAAIGHEGLAAVYLREDQNEKAITECNRTIEIDPNSVFAYIGRARAHAHLGQNAAGNDDLDAATKLPTQEPAGALNRVAWARATSPEDALRSGRLAVSDATQACKITEWKKWRYIDTLAAAYAENGQFAEAVKFQTEALQAANNDDPRRVEKAKERLELYKRRKPYREEQPVGGG